MKFFRLVVLILVVFASETVLAQSLREVVGKYCLIGASLNVTQSNGMSPQTDAVVDKHFNTAVPENCMKGEVVQPEEGLFDFRDADRFIDYCQQHNLVAMGHCLVWHSQAPKWFFHDKNGKLVKPEVLRERMRKHIYTVVGHFRGKIRGWDVVNEAIEDDGSFRNSYYYQILGEEFIELAFRYAHEAAPEVELYYNDYSMAKPGKREAVCRLVKKLKDKGLRIDAVGMQSHNGLDYPNLKEYEKSIEAFAALGVKINMTELDLNVLPSPENFGGAEISQNFEYQEKMNPYKNGLPAKVARQIEKRYLQFFNIYYRHRDKIGRINLWGVSDGDSWLNDWPISGRTNYPLLFDRSYQPKAIVNDIINLYK